MGAAKQDVEDLLRKGTRHKTKAVLETKDSALKQLEESLEQKR